MNGVRYANEQEKRTGRSCSSKDMSSVSGHDIPAARATTTKNFIGFYVPYKKQTLKIK